MMEQKIEEREGILKILKCIKKETLKKRIRAFNASYFCHNVRICSWTSATKPVGWLKKVKS